MSSKSQFLVIPLCNFRQVFVAYPSFSYFVYDMLLRLQRSKSELGLEVTEVVVCHSLLV